MSAPPPPVAPRRTVTPGTVPSQNTSSPKEPYAVKCHVSPSDIRLLSDMDASSLAALQASLEEALRAGAISKLVSRDADGDDVELVSDADLAVAKRLSDRPSLLRVAVYFSSPSVPVKVHVSPSDVRLLVGDFSSLAALRTSLLAAAPSAADPTVGLSWKDQDGDRVSLLSDDDLSFAIQASRHLTQKRPRLHLYLY